MTEIGASDFQAPLYVAWQITNECDLSCLHCIEGSGPGKAFPDELNREDALRILDQLIKAEVPYLSFSGGEPMIHPHFWEMAERVAKAGLQLKIETNGHAITAEAAARLAAIGVKAVQVSVDGASPATFGKMRVRGRFERALEALRRLREAGVPLEVNYVPARFSIHEAAAVVDLAHAQGACAFYTGKIMHTGTAVKSWSVLEPTEEQYAEFFRMLHAKSREYEGRMRVCFHELGLLEELRARLVDPAALFIILPNGRVKLINALPFVCGDLRTQPLAEVWRNFQRGWKDARVAKFVDELGRNPDLTRTLHDWVEVGA